MSAAAPDGALEARGTRAQRLRGAIVGAVAALLAHLPTDAADGLADAVGELWYRAAPGRAARARGNLAHVAAALAASGRGSGRARAAASDPAALELLVRAAFRHAARTYVETLRGAAEVRVARRRLLFDDPETVAAAFGAGGPVVFATLHLGSMMAATAALPGAVTVPVTAPMETLDDPELQRILARSRGAGGTRIVPLARAARETRAALRRGEAVGLVADRDIVGGGIAVPLFGLPASLPIGPAFLALEFGAPLHVAAVFREPGRRYRGVLTTLPHPPADLPRRARVEALLAAEARAFEDLVAIAPEQWWTAFFPIWESVGPRRRDDR